MLAERFAADEVTMGISNDEAGAGECNSAVGNSHTGSEDHTYDHNYVKFHRAEPVHRDGGRWRRRNSGALDL
jgi:hypothetical protein